ncbi:MAG: putative baseplate assembly protein [Actinomycetales bacterium]
MLPAPELDDRTFQQLVDEAKRTVQRQCPSWTDHNVSDPGVTLIEATAAMVDQLIYRLNRVPDRHYVKFLEMIGVELRAPAAARGAVTFWLSAPQPQTVLVRAETEVATARTDIHEAIVFSTLEDLRIMPCAFQASAAHAVGADPLDTTAGLLAGQAFTPFSASPQVGDCLLVGLSEAVPRCAVLVRIDCEVAGVGVDPRNPPLVWEAWTGTEWTGCDLDRDTTGGLNRAGEVVVHVPAGHQTSIVARQRAGWLRCRLIEPAEGQRTYTQSPLVRSLEAFTVGGTTDMEHAMVVHGERLGHCDGSAGQRLSLQHRPLVPSATAELRVMTDAGPQTWTQVSDFASSGPSDRHFRLDLTAGEVHFGPAVRLAEGGLRHYGAVPPLGAAAELTTYRAGGGRVGNVAAGAIRVLKTSVPYVSRVENRAPAAGGADPESLADAKVRGPLLLRSRGRAVTAEDFEHLARDVAPEAARVHCVTAQSNAEAGGIRLLVVPHVASDDLGRVRRDDLNVSNATLQRITMALDEHRLVGTRLLVAPPHYQWVTAVVSVAAVARADPDVVRQRVVGGLYRLLHPLVGGPRGQGWPFGRAVTTHELHAVLAGTPGVDMSRDVEVSLYPAEPLEGQPGRARRGSAVQRLELAATDLVFSYDHQVRVR